MLINGMLAYYSGSFPGTKTTQTDIHVPRGPTLSILAPVLVLQKCHKAVPPLAQVQYVLSTPRCHVELVSGKGHRRW